MSGSSILLPPEARARVTPKLRRKPKKNGGLKLKGSMGAYGAGNGEREPARQGRERLCPQAEKKPADEVEKIADVAATGSEVRKGFVAASVPI